MQGGVDTLADLLSRDALKAYADMPIDATAVQWAGDGHLTVGFLMGKDVPPGSAVVSVGATATGFALDRLIGKDEGSRTRRSGSTSIPRRGLRARGEGRIYGAATTIDLHKPQSGAGEALVTLTLDEAARAKAGFANPALKGPISARITSTLASGDRTRAAVDLDFGRAAIDGLVPGFTKPAGRPARATLNVVQRDGGGHAGQHRLRGRRRHALHGAVDLDREGDFADRRRLAQVKLSPGDDLRVDAQQGADGLKVVARGANLDARPFLKWLSGPSTGGPEAGGKGGLDLDLRSTILTGQNSQAVTGAELHLTRRGGAPCGGSPWRGGSAASR